MMRHLLVKMFELDFGTKDVGSVSIHGIYTISNIEHVKPGKISVVLALFDFMDHLFKKSLPYCLKLWFNKPNQNIVCSKCLKKFCEGDIDKTNQAISTHCTRLLSGIFNTISYDLILFNLKVLYLTHPELFYDYEQHNLYTYRYIIKMISG